MKKFTIIFIAFSFLLISSHGFASVNGMWNMERIEKSSFKVGKAKPEIEIESIEDVWIFHDNGIFELKEDASSPTTLLSGTWSQKGKSFSVAIPDEQMAALIESVLLQDGITATAIIKKSRIFGSEKKDWTIKGRYQVQADLVFPDLSTGKLNLNGSFTGTLPYDTSEYFPLNLGDVWTTREIQTETTQEGEETREEIRTTTIFGTEEVKGGTAMKRGDTEEGDYDLMTNTDGVKVHEMYDADYDDDILTNETFDKFNPPLTYLPPRLSVGTRGTFKSTLTHKESNGFKAKAKCTVEMLVEGLEDVTVPAGDFQDCLRIQLKRNLTANKVSHEETTEGTYWFAKGVGIVRREETSTEKNDNVVEETEISSEELLSATVGGVSYP